MQERIQSSQNCKFRKKQSPACDAGRASVTFYKLTLMLSG